MDDKIKEKALSWVPLFILITIGLAIHLPGINWGLMYKERLSLIFKDTEEIKRLSRKMEAWRREVYKNKAHFLGERCPSLNEDGTILDFSDEVLTETEVSGIRSYFVHTYNPDESRAFGVLSNIRPWKGSFNPHAFEYGGAYLYPLGLFLFLASLLKLVTLNPDLSYYFFHPEEMESLYVAGRMFSKIAVLGGVIILYLLGRRWLGKRAGFLAALFLLTSPLVLFEGHIMKPHIFCMFYSILTLYATIKILLEGRMIWYILGGVGVGLTVGAGGYTAPIFLWLIIAHFLSDNKNRYLWLGTSILMAILTFIITNPFYLLAFSEAKREFMFVYNKDVGGGTRMAAFSLSSFLQSIWTLKEACSLGYPIYFLSILGMIYALARHRRIDIFFLLCLLSSLLPFLSGGYNRGSRFFLFIFPLFFLLGAMVADRCLSSLRFKKVAFLILVLILGYTAFYSFIYISGFVKEGSKDSSRLAAGRWINEYIPYGSTIGIQNFPHICDLPPFRFFNYKLRITKDLSKGDLPPYLLLTSSSGLNSPQFDKYYKPLKVIEGIPFKHPNSVLNHNIEILIKKEK
ncbi:MAG: glycosyltransferase family 39 protein [bacterium]